MKHKGSAEDTMETCGITVLVHCPRKRQEYRPQQSLKAENTHPDRTDFAISSQPAS